jgi:hypothetical protein
LEAGTGIEPVFTDLQSVSLKVSQNQPRDGQSGVAQGGGQGHQDDGWSTPRPNGVRLGPSNGRQNGSDQSQGNGGWRDNLNDEIPF